MFSGCAIRLFHMRAFWGIGQLKSDSNLFRGCLQRSCSEQCVCEFENPWTTEYRDKTKDAYREMIEIDWWTRTQLRYTTHMSRHLGQRCRAFPPTCPVNLNLFHEPLPPKNAGSSDFCRSSSVDRRSVLLCCEKALSCVIRWIENNICCVVTHTVVQ